MLITWGMEVVIHVNTVAGSASAINPSGCNISDVS